LFKVFDKVLDKQSSKAGICKIDVRQCRYCHARQQSAIYCRLTKKHHLPEYTVPLWISVISMADVWEQSEKFDAVEVNWNPKDEVMNEV